MIEFQFENGKLVRVDCEEDTVSREAEQTLYVIPTRQLAGAPKRAKTAHIVLKDDEHVMFIEMSRKGLIMKDVEMLKTMGYRMTGKTMCIGSMTPEVRCSREPCECSAPEVRCSREPCECSAPEVRAEETGCAPEPARPEYRENERYTRFYRNDAGRLLTIPEVIHLFEKECLDNEERLEMLLACADEADNAMRYHEAVCDYVNYVKDTPEHANVGGLIGGARSRLVGVITRLIHVFRPRLDKPGDERLVRAALRYRDTVYEYAGVDSQEHGEACGRDGCCGCRDACSTRGKAVVTYVSDPVEEHALKSLEEAEAEMKRITEENAKLKEYNDRLENAYSVRTQEYNKAVEELNESRMKVDVLTKTNSEVVGRLETEKAGVEAFAEKVAEQQEVIDRMRRRRETDMMAIVNVINELVADIPDEDPEGFTYSVITELEDEAHDNGQRELAETYASLRRKLKKSEKDE